MKPLNYYMRKPHTPLEGRMIPSLIRGIQCEFHSGSSVFSKGRIDPGTHALIETAFDVGSEAGFDTQDKKVLDLGCGIGAVGIFMLRRFPRARLTFSDVNTRALKLTRENIRRNVAVARHGLNKEQGPKVLESDGYATLSDASFDLVLLNPPQHAGRETCLRLIDGTFNHLNPGGVLLLVARHQRGGKTLQAHMHVRFGNAKSVHKSGVFRVYASSKQ